MLRTSSPCAARLAVARCMRRVNCPVTRWHLESHFEHLTRAAATNAGHWRLREAK